MNQRSITVAAFSTDAEREPTQRLAEAMAGHGAICAGWRPVGEIAEAAADYLVAALGGRPSARIAALPRPLQARLIPVGIDRAVVPDLVRTFRLPALVEYDAWRSWRLARGTPTAFVGLRAAAPDLRLLLDFNDPDYAMFAGGKRELPELLVDYLRRLRG